MGRLAVILTNQMLTIKSETNASMFISMFNYFLVFSIRKTNKQTNNLGVELQPSQMKT